MEKSSDGFREEWSLVLEHLVAAEALLGMPVARKTQTQMNLSIKYRESFRPFAPSVLEEKTVDYFDLDAPSPYMLLVAPVKEEIRTPLSNKDQEVMTDPDLLKRVRLKRSSLSAITHVDYSARVQSVSETRNGRYLPPNQKIR